MKGTKHKTHF